MTIEELKALQAKWYAEAVADGSIALCDLVARELGTWRGGEVGSKYRFEEEGLCIFSDHHGNYLTVEWKGKRVCSTHYCDRYFVPGEWVARVRELAVLARQRREGAECRAEEKQRKELMERLGVEEEGS